MRWGFGGTGRVHSLSGRRPATLGQAVIGSELAAAFAGLLGCCGRDRPVSSLCYCSFSRLWWLSMTESLAANETFVGPENISKSRIEILGSSEMSGENDILAGAR